MLTIPHTHGALGEALRLCATHFRYAVFFSALINVVFLAPTFYMLGVYDLVIPAGSKATLGFFTLTLVVTLLFLVTLEQARSQILLAAGLRLDRIFSTRLYAEAMRRPAGTVAPNVTQLIREADLIRTALTGQAALALMDAPWTPIYICVCFLVHPAIGTLALLGTLALITLAIANERVTRESSRRALVAASATSIIQEAAGGASEVVRSLGMSAVFVSRFQETRARYHQPQIAGARATARIGGLIRFLRLLLQSMALGLGAWLVIERQISAGSIFAASMLAARALAPVDQVVAQWRSVSQAITSYRALKPYLSEDPKAAPTRLPAPKATTTLRNVTVVSPGRDRVLLHDISFTLKAGQILGVLGPSGAGKSTLLEVLANARGVDQGEIRIDGARYSDWMPEHVGAFIGYLPQQPTLFPGSVKDNVSRFTGHQSANDPGIDERTIAAAREAEVHELILGLPNGYDSEIAREGRNLSAGQRQRLALARALFGNPVLLVLDEPDSALDGFGQAALGRVLRRARDRGAAIVLAAHNPNLLAWADMLAVVEDGRLKMFGAAEDVKHALQSYSRPEPTSSKPVAAVA